jgi:hypothetical protein
MSAIAFGITLLLALTAPAHSVSLNRRDASVYSTCKHDFAYTWDDVGSRLVGRKHLLISYSFLFRARIVCKILEKCVWTLLSALLPLAWQDEIVDEFNCIGGKTTFCRCFKISDTSS